MAGIKEFFKLTKNKNKNEMDGEKTNLFNDVFFPFLP